MSTVGLYSLFGTVIMYVCAVYLEVEVMHFRGWPRFCGALNILLFVCCAVVSVWDEFFAIIPPSYVTWFTPALEAA